MKIVLDVHMKARNLKFVSVCLNYKLGLYQPS